MNGMQMKYIPVTLIVLLLSGCVSTGPRYTNFWKKDGVDYNTAITAEAGCQYEVGMAKLTSHVEKQNILNACMMKEGFRMGQYLIN